MYVAQKYLLCNFYIINIEKPIWISIIGILNIVTVSHTNHVTLKGASFNTKISNLIFSYMNKNIKLLLDFSIIYL